MTPPNPSAAQAENALNNIREATRVLEGNMLILQETAGRQQAKAFEWTKKQQEAEHRVNALKGEEREAKERIAGLRKEEVEVKDRTDAVRRQMQNLTASIEKMNLERQALEAEVARLQVMAVKERVNTQQIPHLQADLLSSTATEQCDHRPGTTATTPSIGPAPVAPMTCQHRGRQCTPPMEQEPKRHKKMQPGGSSQAVATTPLIPQQSRESSASSSKAMKKTPNIKSSSTVPQNNYLWQQYEEAVVCRVAEGLEMRLFDVFRGRHKDNNMIRQMIGQDIWCWDNVPTFTDDDGRQAQLHDPRRKIWTCNDPTICLPRFCKGEPAKHEQLPFACQPCVEANRICFVMSEATGARKAVMLPLKDELRAQVLVKGLKARGADYEDLEYWVANKKVFLERNQEQAERNQLKFN